MLQSGAPDRIKGISGSPNDLYRSYKAIETIALH